MSDETKTEPWLHLYGLTKRDYFAAAAIQAAISIRLSGLEPGEAFDNHDIDHVAMTAYAIADSMLHEGGGPNER